MKCAGVGLLLWRTRVDVFAPDESGDQVGPIGDALRRSMEGESDGLDAIGVDQGTGVAGRPVIGMIFWVRGDDVGSAAAHARAAADAAVQEAYGETWRLYDVTVIPEDAIARPGDREYPPLPD